MMPLDERASTDTDITDGLFHMLPLWSHSSFEKTYQVSQVNRTTLTQQYWVLITGGLFCCLVARRL